ncbi:chromosome segregation protein SMC [Roseburia sp. 831b]|uniref:chromosome segregation protein SMC n=1 Tax=Roseburia sp. 831b TaxID=1261635 RepID=UPI000952494C|nr:chromosome segregation protein SMC [Roseburia sp. 831b]WVK73573.1 chromosome segregation protein SMC [Roseburia sp. 831b]
MYLKSIEVHGFKSFANKIVFDFHNGITGIVGPNGSGKSNVGDAVRWVLGEQSAKQLRGASMQDIIFAGTENRKPLSYAYVAITMDNSDHALPVEFEEVTVARRVYRSGESEYLLNGNPCRLKDVTELFYDTGIGKEGYSIIGQGQIERILNGKPEERRELFDEAAGIVKYKKRKATAQKKLENERENLVRVNDILSELERQVGPLEKQAEKARIYLKKKEELKTFDVNMFLLEMERIDKQLKEVQDNFQIADGQLKEKNETYTNIKSEYEKMERDVEAIEEKITSIRDTISNSSVTKGKLEGQINVLNEQIHTAKMTDEHMRKRLETIESEKKERLSTKSGYEKEKADLDGQLTNISERKETAQNQYQEVQEKAAKLKEEIENGKNELIQLLNQKASIKARIQRNDTMVEQINIRRAQLNQRLLARKSEETDLESVLEEYQLKLDETNQEIAKLREKSAKMENERREWKQKSIETTKTLEESLAKYHKNQSRLESLKNIAERYDGYGNSIRKVMEQKAANKGLLGVVSDLIQVDKKYEIAIETALGGNIQNIVTEDEETAKKMISYLKANRFGRATFLPITSVDGRGNFKNHDALKEKGVIGLANTLVKTDAKYEGVIAYLLGRVVVTENIDHAIALARKNHYSLHIVTLEGEYLSPGGSMAGGAFKNSSNLLARKREVEELEKKVQDLDDAVKDSRKRLEEIKTAQALLADDMEENRKNLQEMILAQNTAKMNVDRVVSKKNESETVYQGLQTEHKEMEGQLAEIEQEKAKIAKESEDALAREKEIGVQNEAYQKELEEQDLVIEKAGNELSKIQLEEANLRQKAEFVTLNIERIETELAKFDAECEQVQKEAEEAKEEVQKKLSDIEEIKKTILASDGANENLANELQEALNKKEELSASYKGFFQKQEEISKEITELEKEIFRLNSQREKLEDAHTYQNNYMWEEYELTLHAAMELRNEEYQNLSELKKEIANIKDEIRKLGDVNVNAIEDYKEISERYTFLKGQHDDLIEAEQTLVNIIEELDTGMRKQFLEKFAEIQKEFDKVFKELFGGGKGSLELVEDEDILECGIRIIAQPPGKKLQNMMQMSGGEKSLTAISLLFAIQNLKPSPFCLLDEIEAALDDSNVSRFAKYLHKLTKNTQFIVITHRRGTMAAADRLYGITMQEKGVSTLVSVNLIEDELDK